MTALGASRVPTTLTAGSAAQARAALRAAAGAAGAADVAAGAGAAIEAGVAQEAESAARAARAGRASLPGWWVSEALCIHRHESSDWHRATDWRGGPSPYHGGMQIAVGTWAVMAPRSYPREPAAATPREQLVVAHRIWLANGRRFGGSQWFLSAEACGVR